MKYTSFLEREFKSMSASVLGRKNYHEKRQAVKNLEESLKVNGVLLPSRKKRIDFWLKVIEEGSRELK